LRECLKAAGGGNATETVPGLRSLVSWALMIVVTLKYVLFIMRANNDNEGGIMALLGRRRIEVARGPLRLVGKTWAGLWRPGSAVGRT